MANLFRAWHLEACYRHSFHSSSCPAFLGMGERWRRRQATGHIWDPQAQCRVSGGKSRSVCLWILPASLAVNLNLEGFQFWQLYQTSHHRPERTGFACDSLYMLLQRKNGYVGLPSPFSHSSRCLWGSSGTKSPGPSRRESRRNHQSFVTTGLGWRSIDRFLSPAKEVANGTSRSPEFSHLRRPGRDLGGEPLSPAHPHGDGFATTQQSSGTGLSPCVEPSRGHSRPPAGQQHSLSRLLSRSLEALGPTQPLARRWRSVSEQDLRTRSPERVQKEAELETLLREADRPPRGEMEELRKLEADLNVMKFELLSLKQRMESSFAVLEKEKTWLEMLSSGDRKRKWKRKDRIFPLKLELPEAKPYSGRRRNGLLSRDPSQNEDMGKKDVSQATPADQETQVAQESGIRASDKEQEAVAQRLKSTRESQQMVPGPTAEANQQGTSSPQTNQALHKGTGQLQTTDKSINLVNRELSLEVAGSCQSLEVSSDSLHHLEAEEKNPESCVWDLGNECARLLEEREERIPEGQPDGPSREEELNALQVACENLRESQSLLQREKGNSETRCLELEAALRDQREETERHLAEQKQVSQQWQERWQQVAAALKKKEEELEEARLQSQASSAQLETLLLLQIQLDACKQELELERSRSQALHHYVQDRESESESDAVPTSETAPQEVDTEVVLVREELQKVWDMLRSRDTELEEKQLELETARNQYAECSSEKQSLDQLVASLEEQLAEKEQALRRLEKAQAEDRTEKMKVALLEQKLAEMEAAQDLPGLGFRRALETQEGQENVWGDNSQSRGTCRLCSSALAQLNRVVQSVEKREKEDQTLACLYRLQELLKRSISNQAPDPEPVQSRSQDPSARVIQSPQEEKELLRQRHQLVTEQLKRVFRQRQQLELSKTQPGRGKEERSPEPQKSQEVLAAPESTWPPEEQPAAPDGPSCSAEVQRLKQLLKEKTETISSMASEIQALQQKNESLMKAKLRFQQQIQQIRNFPKQRLERSAPDPPVPRLSVTLGQDLQSAQGSDSSLPSPQSDEPPFTGSREDLSQAPWGSHLPAGTEDRRRGSSSDEGPSQVPQAPPSPPIPSGPPARPFSLELPPSRQADSEGALASPRGSALLSPRPFGPPRPWSPFKFRGNPELPEDGEKR